MKKIFFFKLITLLSLTTISCGQNNPFDPNYGNYSPAQPQIIDLAPDGTSARVQIGNQIIRMEAIYSPGFDDYGRVIYSGRTSGKGIVVDPPVRPQGWVQDRRTGQYFWDGSVNKADPSMGSCIILKGRWVPTNTGKYVLSSKLETISGFWSGGINTQKWMGAYAPNTYQPYPGWVGYVDVAYSETGYLLY